MPVAVERLNSLWRELGNMDAREEAGDAGHQRAFYSLPRGTPVFDIWAWFEAGNERFSVAVSFTAKPLYYIH